MVERERAYDLYNICLLYMQIKLCVFVKLASVNAYTNSFISVSNESPIKWDISFYVNPAIIILDDMKLTLIMYSIIHRFELMSHIPICLLSVILFSILWYLVSENDTLGKVKYPDIFLC